MAKLKIWIAKQHDDSHCYNLIGKTKKEVLKQIEKNSHNSYDTIGQYEITYKDAFALFEWATSENGGRSGGSGSYKILSEQELTKKRHLKNKHIK